MSSVMFAVCFKFISILSLNSVNNLLKACRPSSSFCVRLVIMLNFLALESEHSFFIRLYALEIEELSLLITMIISWEAFRKFSFDWLIPEAVSISNMS